MPGKKLLVADDSLTIQKVIRLALTNEGYDIQAVSDGNDAIQQITLRRPDVVLIDVSLPGKNAFEVKKEVNTHEDLADVRFVLMSSAFEKIDEAQAQQVQLHGRLTKPFDPAHLRQILVDVLKQVGQKPPSQPPQNWGKPSALDLPPPLPPPFSNAVPSSFPDQFPDSLPAMQSDMPILPDSPPSIANDDFSQWQNPPSFANDLPPLPEAPSELPPSEELWSPSEPTEEDTGLDDIKQLTESTMKISGLQDYQWSVSEPSSDSPKSETPEMAESASASVAEKQSVSAFDSLTSQQIEAMVKEQIETTLLKMVQSSLPDLAEKLIKQEIHKLLSGTIR